MKLIAFPGDGVAEPVVSAQQVMGDGGARARRADKKDRLRDHLVANFRMLTQVLGEQEPLAQQIGDV